MELIKAYNGIEYLRADNMVAPHAFSTRIGGVSRLSHTSSLNLAFGRGDDTETVLKNLSLFSEAVGFDAARIVSVSQIHSTDVKEITAADAGKGYFLKEDFSCDGYVTSVSGVTLGVKTADCVPILMEGYDQNGRVCAVGALHAGWRGTVGRIALKGLEKMKKYGADLNTVRIAIGPAICKDCFEVRQDFYDKVKDILGEELTEKFVIADIEHNGLWHTDLRELNRYFLVCAGVPCENIEISDECTCCTPERYFSHRYSKGERGTMLSVITMP